MQRDLWIFGYGSLIFRPDFPYQETVVGKIDGYHRRFWQASEDHRGTPGAPGRVVTLVAESGTECWGIAFRVSEADRDEVLRILDEREKGGYVNVELPFTARAGGASPSHVMLYVGLGDNAFFVGPEDEHVTLAIIRQAVGPSGSNAEYVVRLAQALEELGVVDEYVSRIAQSVGRYR